MKKRSNALLMLVMLACMALALPAAAISRDQPREKLVFFFSQTCHNCHEVKEGILSMVARDHRGRIDIEYRDIGDMDNYKLLLGLRDKMGLNERIQVPAIYYSGRLLTGQDAIENTLLDLIRQSPSGRNQGVAGDGIQPADLLDHFRSFTPAAVSGAGLIDGINPCAFTVMVFFISFLSLQGYRRRELVCIGTAFIVSVFLTYLLLGLGLFNFLYGIKGVFVVRKALNIGMGVFAFVLAIAAIVDIARFLKTGLTEGMMLQLPQPVKRQIQKVIGLAYRKAAGRDNAALRSGLAGLCATALATGVLVSLLEAVCTGQVYLPTITFVLKSSSLRIQAAGYLVLYNVMFIVPLAVIFLFALAGVSSGQFSKFLRRHFLAIKTLMAVMFLVFAVFLLWRD